MKTNLPVSGRAVEFSANANILSTTNPKGAITYVNPDFINLSGFSEAELLGVNHNIVRHPDMPPEAFAHMWQTLKDGRSWMGLVKNRCKNGDHYWVSAYVTPMQRNASEFLINEVCFSNPLGCGWLEHRHEKLHYEQTGEKLTSLPAPQIEHLDEPIERLLRSRHPAGPLNGAAMAEVAASYGCRPAGFGIVGRAWAPRLALAGTYDESWEDNQWPGLPQDFDFGYWNGAPVDQQVAFPTPDARVALFNLIDPSLSQDGQCEVQLPGHRPFVLMRMTNGVMLPLPMLTDTLRIDTDAMTLSMTHRISLPSSLDIRVLEARFETNPDAPIIRRAPHRSREHV